MALFNLIVLKKNWHQSPILIITGNGQYIECLYEKLFFILQDNVLLIFVYLFSIAFTISRTTSPIGNCSPFEVYPKRTMTSFLLGTTTVY